MYLSAFPPLILDLPSAHSEPVEEYTFQYFTVIASEAWQSGSLRGAAPLLEKIYSLSLRVAGWAGIQRGFTPAGIWGTG
jgi:hypothetical protein